MNFGSESDLRIESLHEAAPFIHAAIESFSQWTQPFADVHVVFVGVGVEWPVCGDEGID
jgi:hypothetical protein